MVFYHATPLDNLGSICSQGLYPGPDGVVYLCKKPKECLRFSLMYGVISVLVCKVDIPKEWVIETFDHSFEFFRCRCFGSTRPISATKIKAYTQYDLSSLLLSHNP